MGFLEIREFLQNDNERMCRLIFEGYFDNKILVGSQF